MNILAWFAGLGALFFGWQNKQLQQVVTEAADNVPALRTDTWTQYDYLYQKYAAENGIDWQWVKAFALNESYNGQVASVRIGIENPFDIENSKSSDGKSWGIMQMTLPTARGIDDAATQVKLNNPEYSINLGCQYIAELAGMYSEADPRYLEYVVKSYNQGPGNMRKEIAGTGGGFANEYWDRWQRNLTKAIGA